MKKFLKWFSIIIGVFVLIVTLIVAYILISHDLYGFYTTGGKISELQKDYDALFYDLNLEIDSEEQSIKGYVVVGIRSLVDKLNIIELDLIDNFEITKVELEDKELQFEHEDDKLFVSLQKSISQNKATKIIIYYSGHPPEAIRPPWIGGFNWSKDKNENDWIGVSCQGEGSKIWFPSKDHPSDEPDSVSINITVPKNYFCASNGVLENVTEPREGFTTYHWFTRYPTNNYNISINIAKYEIIEKSYTSIDGNNIPVVYYYLNDKKEIADSLVEMAIDMLKTLEKYYGEYPFAKEKFGLVETSYWGMEHQTINSYGNNYRFTKREGFNFDQLMLHEMTHEWWGNKVTVKDWADFWLHEGIGTYSEAIYLLDKLGEKGYHDHMSRKKSGIRNTSPILKPENTNSYEAYTGDIYNKGAYFMHSLRYTLGDSLFFPILYQFATDSHYTYQNLVNSEDLLRLVNKNSGEDYTDFFNLFLKTTDLPDVQVDSLGDDKWNVSIPNINFELQIDLEIDGNIIRKSLSSEPLMLESRSEILIDPNKWYLLKSDFETDK